MKKLKCYKVFDPDWKCRGFQYEVGKSYSIKEEPILCEIGFHACQRVSNCFSYYSLDPKNKVAEVELSGIIVGMDGDKQVAQKIKILKEISWNDMLLLANTGIGNTGYSNSGNSNSGDFNSTTPDMANFFNKPCKLSVWNDARKPDFIYNVHLNRWVSWAEMTDKEKTDNKNAFVTDGYLKTIGYKEAWAEAYRSASKEDIKLLKALPNFSADVFEEITGIKIK